MFIDGQKGRHVVGGEDDQTLGKTAGNKTSPSDVRCVRACGHLVCLPSLPCDETQVAHLANPSILDAVLPSSERDHGCGWRQGQKEQMEVRPHDVLGDAERLNQMPRQVVRRYEVQHRLRLCGSTYPTAAAPPGN